MPWFKTFLLASLATAAPPYVQKSNVKCPITLDGRIPQNFTLKTFDTTVSPYNPGYTKGENLSWSEILLFPRVPPSRFDFDGASSSYRPIEVTINDSSIFRPGGGDLQVGFRRAGLLLGNGNDASNVGVAVYHWSNLQNRRKDWNMNLTHEYMNVWHEGNDYSHNQFSINAGVMLSQDNPFDVNGTKTGDSTKVPKTLWKILDRWNNIVFNTPIKYGVWENWGIRVDYDENTLQIYYSTGLAPLKAVTKLLPNDNAGGGVFQIGVMKKPTETKTVVFDGYQESGIHEGQIYGGIFVEDGRDGCLSV